MPLISLRTKLFCAAAGLLSFTVWAQETTDAITATIHDRSGDVVPGATVTIKNEGTGATRSLVTSDQGAFAATLLPVGSYEVDVEKPGFKKSVTSGIALSVKDRLALSNALEVGSVTETASVEATVPLIETESATMSGLVDSRKVIDLPLNGRNFAQLIELQSGVSDGARL